MTGVDEQERILSRLRAAHRDLFELDAGALEASASWAGGGLALLAVMVNA